MMEMNNSLVAKKPKSAGVVTYDAGGTQVTLSFDLVKRYLVSGGGDVSDQEVMMYIGMCKAQHLNPFNREAYLIKYGSNSPATMITAEMVFLKRAQQNPDFDGLQAGIIVQNEDGMLTEREGTFYIPETERLVGGWCKVYTKGKRIPSYESVNLSEYIGRKKDGSVNEQWSKRPATMIRKVARVHALKEAFPSDLGGLYAQEEIEEAQEIILPEAAVSVPETAPAYENAAQIPDQGYEQAAFFPEDAAAAQPGPVSDPASALFS